MGKLPVSSSLIRDVLKKGDYIEDTCPKYLLHRWIYKSIESHTSDPMKKGLYFETLCLGGSARGQSLDDLPRKNGGGKTVDQERIEEQAEHFKFRVAKDKILLDSTNTQVKLSRRWEKDKNIILTCEKDIFPTTRLIRVEGESQQVWCEIDLKLSADMNTTYGDYCWGSPEFIDQIQALLYLYITEDIDLELNRKLHGNHPAYDALEEHFEMYQKIFKSKFYKFYYWIFSYKKAGPDENKFIEVELTDTKRMEMHESIRKTIQYFKDQAELGFPPHYSNKCIKCKVLDCEGKQREQII